MYVLIVGVCPQKLLWCREVLCQQARCADLELSMGMTNDYEHAVSLPTFLPHTYILFVALQWGFIYHKQHIPLSVFCRRAY